MASVNFADVITFTRASGGGRFNAQGQYEWLPANEPRIDYDPVTGECRGLLVEESRTNLLTYSEQFDNAAWGKARATVKANSIVSPRGDVTGSKVTGNATGTGFLLSRNSIAAAGASQTQSFYLKRGSLDFACLVIGDNALANAARQWFNLNTGALGSSNSGGSGFSVTSAEVTNVGGGWFRCSVTVTGTGGTYAAIVYPAVSSNLGFGFTVGDYGYIWGAQLEAGAFPTSYIPTPAIFTGRASTGTYFDADGVLKIAAAGEARYTHAYVDGKWVSAGLLLEESRTNLLTYSSDFANAVWTKQFVSIEDNAATSPDGAVNAAKMVTAAGTTRGVYLIPSGYALNTDHTLSVFAKAAGRNTLRLEWNGSGTVEFDLISGTKLGGPATAGIAHVGNGWYRCWTVGQRSSTGQAVVIRFGAAEQTGGDGTSGIYIWGAQLEAGSSPTSYIPTTTAQVTRAADVSSSAQVTRSADVASVNTLSPWYNASEGTIVVKATRFTTISSMLYQLIKDASNRIWCRSQSGGSAEQFVSVVGGVNQAGFTPAAALTHRSAFAYKENDFAVSLNGASALTDVSGSVPSGITRLDIGHEVGLRTNGHIQSLEYYPRRLSNTELQEITA